MACCQARKQVSMATTAAVTHAVNVVNLASTLGNYLSTGGHAPHRVSGGESV
jgi:hypothetical protein